MARSYDNWERLVTATLRREDLRLTGQRTPSELSLASLSSFSSFSLASSSRRVSSFNLSSLLVGESFSYHQILQVTDYLSESNLIKYGNFGDIFYRVLKRRIGVLKRGTQVIVKKIDLSLVTKESLFIAELEVLRKVSLHQRFVPLVGHCLENEKEKFLVYKHMANKDLSTSLSVEQSPFLNWTTRLKIATEVAEDLCYLHQCVPPVAHSGRTALATAYTETLGSGTASRNHGISQAGGSEETYPNGGIFAQPSLTIFSYSELMDATRHFGSVIAVREGEFRRVYQAWLPDISSSKHGN